MKISRRQFLTGCAGAVATGCAVPAYARWVEPRWLRIDRVAIPFFRQPVSRPLRVLHLSDLHLSPVVPLAFIERSIRAGLAEQTDLAVITGDFITKELHEHNAYVRVLRRLSDRVPVFAILGNHDGGRWARARGGYASTHAVRTLLSQSGVQLIHNDAKRIQMGDRSLWLIGMGDLWADELNADEAFASIPDPSDAPRLILSHNPDSKDALGAFPWELLLCGHSHGGQIALPGMGTPFAPVLDHRYVSGLNPWRERWIYTSRGVGNLHGFRLNCRPEISVLELATATESED